LCAGYPERPAVLLQSLQRGKQHPKAGTTDVVEVAEVDEEDSPPGIEHLVDPFFRLLRRAGVEPPFYSNDIDGARSSFGDLNMPAHQASFQSDW
jgi:hypothetical protein